LEDREPEFGYARREECFGFHLIAAVSRPETKILFTLRHHCSLSPRCAAAVPRCQLSNVQQCIKEASSGEAGQIYSLINLFSGGALLKLTVFAVGVMPYITASIIVQLLTVVIPRFEELRKEGQAGKRI